MNACFVMNTCLATSKILNVSLKYGVDIKDGSATILLLLQSDTERKYRM